MAKVIYKGLAKKDDPIYTGKYVVSSLKKRIINKKEKKNGKNNMEIFPIFKGCRGMPS